jgi:hypothetical protein
MALPLRRTSISKRRKVSRQFNVWNRGLNTLVNATKIDEKELAVANNVILEDEGVPNKRWGTATYGDDSGGTLTTGLFTYNDDANGIAELLKIEDGIFKKLQSDNSWDIVSGASFTSGVETTGVQLNDVLYLSNGTDDLTKYDGAELTSFTEIAAPSFTSAFRSTSLLSGENLYSYRVTALNGVGETLAAAAATVATEAPREDWSGFGSEYFVTINWTPSTGATGYNIYGVKGAFETYLDTIDTGATSYKDYGITTPSDFFILPDGNTTTGPKGKYITSFKSSLILTGDPTEPSRVHYSAGLDKPDSFLISDGGGYIDISKGADDGPIKGQSEFQNKTIIFKERSVWQLDFTTGEIPALANLVLGRGGLSHRAILPVENDLFYVGEKKGGGPAIYVLGNEPNFFTILRTNELSSKVRPDLKALVPANYEKANSVYYDGRYIFFYTDGSATTNNRAIVYDRERVGFTKWLDVYARDAKVFYDSSGTGRLVFTDESDNRITQMSDSYDDDKGTAIEWKYRTKTEQFKAIYTFKRFTEARMQLRNITGEVDLKFFTGSNSQLLLWTSLTGQIVDTSFGSGKFGVKKFTETVSAGVIPASDTIFKRIPLRRLGQGAISSGLALEISGSKISSKAALLDLVFDGVAESSRRFERSELLQI